jgi:hypothetical protein
MRVRARVWKMLRAICSANNRPKGSRLFKLLVGPALFAWMVHSGKLNLHDVVQGLWHWPAVLVILILLFIQPTITAWRWNLLLSAQEKVIASLEDLGWMDSRAVACVVTHVIRHAYVHHTESRDRLIEGVLGRLHQFRVYPIGRYGL